MRAVEVYSNFSVRIMDIVTLSTGPTDAIGSIEISSGVLTG